MLRLTRPAKNSSLYYMEYLKNLNDKQSAIDNDNCAKMMYSCGRNKEKCKPSSVANIIGTVGIVAILLFVAHRFFAGTPRTDHILDFTKNLEVSKMFVGLLLLTNIKNLSNSLISNIILPILEPILPLISCSMRLDLGLFSLEVGNFVSDVLVFAINIYIIYFIFILMPW